MFRPISLSSLKLTVALATLACACASHAAPASRPLTDQASIVAALDAGHRVSVSIDLSLCTPQSGSNASTTKGGINAIDSYRVLPGPILSFSDPRVAVSSNTGAAIFLSLRYAVAADNSIVVSSSIFSLPDYASVSQSAFDCRIGTGVNFIDWAK